MYVTVKSDPRDTQRWRVDGDARPIGEVVKRGRHFSARLLGYPKPIGERFTNFDNAKDAIVEAYPNSTRALVSRGGFDAS